MSYLMFIQLYEEKEANVLLEPLKKNYIMFRDNI